MRISKDLCTGLVIDIQERLFPHMDQKDELLRKSIILIKGLKALEVPLICTEQYPKGLGSTLEPVVQALGRIPSVEKSAFSCCDEANYLKTLKESSCTTIIICGIEAHVCVLQTVVDLIGAAYLPVVVEDCISSRNPNDKRVAVERMRDEGAIITTCESILFELARVSGTHEFKAISSLVK